MANDTDNNKLSGSDLKSEPSRAASPVEDQAAALSNQMLDLMIKHKIAAGGSEAAKGAVSGAASAAAGSDAASAIKGAVMGGAGAAAATEAQRATQGGKEATRDSSGESQMKNLKDLSPEERAKILKDAGVNSGAKDSSGASDRIKNHEIIENFKRIDHELVFKPSDGIRELRTGDKFVKDGDREILFMPNGDKLSVNKDGSFDLKSKGGVEVKKEGGVTTITFANGDKVSFSKQGIETIQRGNTVVDFIDPAMFNKLRNRMDHEFERSPIPPNSIDKLPNHNNQIVPDKKQLDIPGGIYEKLQRN
jgi:hypothetical protein